jgi:energy-coupling factor transporter ATP-binding protein EcfA2
MITNISLQDFKCFRHLSIDPKLVTVLIGANGTGKSSVLQGLMLLKQSTDPGSRSCLVGPLVRIEEHDFPRRDPLNTGLTVGLSFSGKVGSNSLQLIDKNTEVTFSSEAEFSPDGVLHAHWGSVSFSDSRKTVSAVLGKDQEEARFLVGPHEIWIGRASWPRVFGITRTPVDTEPQLIELLRDGAGSPSRILQSMRVVQPIRGMVRPEYPLGAQISEDISLVAGLSQQEEDLATTLEYSRGLTDQVSTWMKRITGVGFKTELIPSQKIRPVAISTRGNVNLAAEGFGTNALVGLLLQLTRAEPGATLLIEEPEIHLHPKAQAELAEVLTEEAEAHGKQMIMATHSEHILSRLLTLVAEKKLSKDDLAVYSFEKDDDGTCTASEIEVTDSGQVIGGLKGFFDTNLDEMDRYVKALQSNQ